METTRQSNYTTSESALLPSEGKIYNKRVEPTVELRPMTGREELRRTAPSVVPLKLISNIIEDCCIEKPAIHVYDMAIGDYEYLMHRLRIITHTNEYKIDLVCPHCGRAMSKIIDLDAIPVKEFDIDRFNALRTFVLPKSGYTVSLNFQTPRMLDQIAGYAKEMRAKYKTAEIDFDTEAVLVTAIDSVNGEHLDRVQVEDMLNKLPAADLVKILQNIELMNKQIGLDTELNFTCDNPSCPDGRIKTFFRFGPEFFRPTNL